MNAEDGESFSADHPAEGFPSGPFELVSFEMKKEAELAVV